MRLRFSLALLVIIIITIIAPASSLSNDDGAVKEEEWKLKPEEEREALELIERFVSRYDETNDITPLLDEFFIEDFAARRTKYPESWLPYAYICRNVAAQASESEWRRYYAAMVNLWYWGRRLYNAGGFADKQYESDGEQAEALFTPEIIRVLKDDYVFVEMFGDEDEKRNAGGNDECNTFGCACPSENLPADKSVAPQAGNAEETGKVENSGISVKTIERMNHLSELMEKANSMTREKWVKLEKLRADEPIQNYSLSNSEDHTESPDVTITVEDFFGYPAGTRLICYQAIGLHVCMVRDKDGRLKILSFGLSFEGD